MLEGVTVTPLAYAELPMLLGRKRLRLGGRKGQHREEQIQPKGLKKKKAVKRSWNFPSQQSQGEHQAKC